jgi:hypothetical protein
MDKKLRIAHTNREQNKLKELVMKKMVFLAGFVFLMVYLYAQNTSDFEVQGNNDNTMTIVNYKGQVKNIIIPDKIFNMPVTRLQNDAFQGKGLTGVVMPATITFIGDNTFEGNNLTTVVLPNTLKYIGNGAFKKNKLTNITIPGNVATIGSQAFYGNDLTSIVIPDSVKYIGNEAFRRNLLTSAKIGNGVIYIGNFAFYTGNRNNNSGNPVRITDLTIGNNVMHIGSGAFNGIATDTLTLPNTLVYVASDAFDGVGIFNGAGVPQGYWHIQSANAPAGSSQGYWDISGDYPAGSSMRSGQQLMLYQYVRMTDLDRLYRFTSAGDDWVNIIAQDGHYVDIDNNNNGNGVRVQLWDGNGHVAQKFKLIKVSTGLYKIMTTHGRLLATRENSANDGVAIHTWEDNASNSALWRLVEPNTGKDD